MPPLILVIEDDLALLELYGLLLAEEGYRVVLAEHPYDDALEVARIAPDVIILDYRFRDEKRGLALIDALRRHPPTATIPILLCSAVFEAEERVQAYLNDRTRLLLKPFAVEELLALVATLLGVGRSSALLPDETDGEERALGR